MKLLVVESDSLMGEALQIGLGSIGFRSDRVKTSRAALAALRLTTTYRLVVLDAQLPLPDVSGVVARCRGLATPIPVLLLTKRGPHDGPAPATESEGDALLAKPVDLTDLDRMIRQLIGTAASFRPS